MDALAHACATNLGDSAMPREADWLSGGLVGPASAEAMTIRAKAAADVERGGRWRRWCAGRRRRRYHGT